MASHNLPFGHLLGVALGGVDAYCSDYSTAKSSPYLKRGDFQHSLDGVYLGYKWQCVEFARRWLYLCSGFTFADVGMAYEIFRLPELLNPITGERKGLKAIKNGSEQAPMVGAMLIWAEGGEFARTGHVAIITEVSERFVRIAEQNVHFSAWLPGADYARELKLERSDKGNYFIHDSFDNTRILGWLNYDDAPRFSSKAISVKADLALIKAQQVHSSASTDTACLNLNNADEAAYVEAFASHGLSTNPDLSLRYFVISEQMELRLAQATNELHDMFMHATEHVLKNPSLLAQFCFPPEIIERIHRSWSNRVHELVTSRFDFALSDKGLKVYEYNCDSASCYMETGKIQGKWAQHVKLTKGRDGGSHLSSLLSDTWRANGAQQFVHILRDEDAEEAYHALYMQSCIEAAGIKTKIIVKSKGLSLSSNGDILDEDGRVIKWVWKTWAWETALDQIRADLANDNEGLSSGLLSRSVKLSDVLFHPEIMVYEPLWSLIPSNKAILPIIWSLYPNHPLLLEADFELTDSLLSSGYVTKPIVGRCGANISLFDESQKEIASTGGKFGEQTQIYQQLFPLAQLDGLYVQLCTFTAAGRYVGCGTRVDASMVINKDSDCLALRVIDNDEFLTL